MRTSTKYNKIVDISEDGEITVLNDVFSYDNNHKGATGSKFYPITEEQIQDRISELEGDDMELLKYMADNFGEVTRAMIDNIDSSRDALIEMFFDLSYSEQWDDLRKQANLTKEDAIIFDCVGGGRCFDKNFQGNVNIELSEIIREYEN